MTDDDESELRSRLRPIRKAMHDSRNCAARRGARISVRVSAEQRARFERAAHRNGRTLANWLRWLGDTATTTKRAG